jgi:hypothetical protein
MRAQGRHQSKSLGVEKASENPFPQRVQLADSIREGARRCPGKGGFWDVRLLRPRPFLEMVGETEYTARQAISPLLRSDFAQSTVGRTPNGDLTDSFVPSDGRAA